VGEQQLDAVGEPERGRREQQVLEHGGRRRLATLQPGRPRPAVARAEPVVEQDLEPRVVGRERPVVERLPVVRVGTRLEQHRQQRRHVAVRRLVRVVLPAADRTGQRRERRHEPLPQVAGVRVGALRQQQPRDGDRIVAGWVALDAAVGQVEERLPAMRAARRARRRGIAREQRGGRRDISDRGRDVDRTGRQRRVRLEQRTGVIAPRGIVAAVGQTGEAQELPRRRLVAGAGGRRRLVGRAAVPVDHLEVADEARPARKVVAARHDELGVGARQRRRVGTSRVERRHPLERSRVACAAAPLQLLRDLAQVLQVRVARKTARFHRGPPLGMPAVRIPGPEGGRTTGSLTHAQDGLRPAGGLEALLRACGRG
jgi:hypothetical protein